MQILKTIAKRLGALIAGILLTLLGGILVYESFGSHADRYVGKLAWACLLVGLGFVIYAFAGSAKKTEHGQKAAETESAPPQ